VELEQPWEWERIAQVTERTRHAYADLAMEGARRLCERLGKRFVVSMPDLGRGLDVLAAIRGNANLLMDLLIAPDRVQSALDVIERLWHRFHREFADIIYPANHHGCYAECMRYLSARSTHIAECDFAAMIGPEQFAQFALPVLQRECEEFEGRVVFHMDGPGQMPHLDLLCGVEQLHAVQWVPGAGNPGTLSEKWYPLYRTLIDAGKRICLGGAEDNVAGIRALFAAFPKQEFLLPFTLAGPEQADWLVNGLR